MYQRLSSVQINTLETLEKIRKFLNTDAIKSAVVLLVTSRHDHHHRLL